MENTNLQHHLPYKLVTAGDQLQCHWLNTHGRPFSEPFFDETILKCRSVSAANSLFSSVSSLEMMKEWAGPYHNIEPAALIFHISRCGSTLVSQLLASSSRNIVLSEVPFFDDLLRLAYKADEYDQTRINELFKAALKFYGQGQMPAGDPPPGHPSRLFIKTDSWHLFFYEQLRQLFPAVPFILIYRSPDQVLSSHSKVPGMQAVPGLIEPQLFGLHPDDLHYRGPGVYLSMIIERYLGKCLEIAAADNLFLQLNYNEGPMSMIKKIAAFTNTALSSRDLFNMEERSRYHSKKPGEQFIEEAAAEAPPCLEKAMAIYKVLEEKRMSISSPGI